MRTRGRRRAGRTAERTFSSRRCARRRARAAARPAARERSRDSKRGAGDRTAADARRARRRVPGCEAAADLEALALRTHPPRRDPRLRQARRHALLRARAGARLAAHRGNRSEIGGNHVARGSVVKRQSGNYAIVYYVDGKQRWETIGPSRREAERALTARKREVDTGTWREPSSETLASYAERWLANRDPARVSAGRTRLAPSTFAEYRRALLTHVSPRLGTRSLASLRTEDVDALIAALEAEGKAPGTVRNIVTPLRRMLADAVRQGKLVANPAAGADLPPAHDFIGKEIPHEHTDAIRASLLNLAPTDPLQNEPDLFYVYFF